MFVQQIIKHEVGIPTGPITLEGELIVPSGASGIVLFAHGSGPDGFLLDGVIWAALES